MDRGRPAGTTPVVLLHGLGQDGSQLRSVAATLGTERVDTPNVHPASARAVDHGVPALLRALHRLLERTDTDPVIGGVSMGAAVTLELALSRERSLAGLVQIAPAVGPDGLSDAAVDYVHWLISVVEAGGFGALRQQLLDAAPSEGTGDAQLAAVDQWERTFSPDVLVAAWRGFVSSVQPVSPAALSRLRVPVLVVGWDSDALHPLPTALLYADAIPDAELTVVDAPLDGHLSEHIGTVVGDFLARLPAAR